MAGDPAGAHPRVRAFGDSAVLIELADVDVSVAAARSQALARTVRRETDGRPGWGAVVPAAASVLVHVDPVRPGVADALEVVRAIVAGADPAEAAWPRDPPTVDIAVRYGGADGPDLEEVAALTGLSPATIVERHASMTYRVLFLGFAPGFAYLGPLPAELIVPRRASPRIRVPAGSVAIAGPHTAVYPTESPGGWQLVGRTTVTLWDPRREPPALLEPGALVRFVPEPDR